MRLNQFFFVAALTAVAATPAWADARDDVQAAETRCAGIADAQTWLNCYYGAADPMRRQLGLAPAPAFQVGLVPPPSSVPVRLPQSAAKPEETKESWLKSVFGSTRSADAPVASRIETYSFDRGGIFTVSLANGQVWQQLLNDAHHAHWHGSAVNYSILIQPAASGDFQMTVQGTDTHDVYRVRRLH